MRKKIVHVIGNVRPGGGPGGYLYNLKQMLKMQKSNSVQVVSMHETNDNAAKSGLSRHIEGRNKLYQKFIDIFYIGYASIFKKVYDDATVLQLKDYEYVVFHDLNMLRNYMWRGYGKKQKIGVMIHSPIDPSRERAESLFGSKGAVWYQYIIDVVNLKLTLPFVDYVLLPCREAVEGYSEKYRKAIFQKRIIINPTGYIANDKELITPQLRKEERARLGFTDGDIVLGYFGRYNKDKGFDVFNMAASMDKSARLKFICAGQGPIVPHSNIKNLGWIKNVSHYIGLVDYIVVPNNVCYFDLIVLEALSLGANVIVTYVGGSKILDKDFVHFIHGHTVHDKAHQINEIALNNHAVESSLIKNYFNDNFSPEKFVERFEKID